MFNLNKKTKLITHSSGFHSDDVFATATLFILLGDENCEVIRTRDENIIKTGDFVYDVGGIYDAEKDKFDHHQEGGAGKRENNIPYSSFGLIWKKYGEQLCGSKEVADELDKKIVQPIDAMDNGIKVHKLAHEDLQPYLVNDLTDAFLPSWLEDDTNGLFLEIVNIAKRILEREIKKIKDVEKSKDILEDIYKKTEDKRIIVLDRDYPWENILNKYPEPMFVVKDRGDRASVKGVRGDMYSFDYRKYFPESWAGKQGQELAQITGVEDALFCHNARFICATKSKEGAIALAKLALSSAE